MELRFGGMCGGKRQCLGDRIVYVVGGYVAARHLSGQLNEETCRGGDLTCGVAAVAVRVKLLVYSGHDCGIAVHAGVRG